MSEGLDARLDYLKRQARKRGLGISVDKRLNQTEYRAAHPLSKKFVGDDIVVRKNSITVAPFVARNKKKMTMDVYHELLENKKARDGFGYKPAHNFANRKQRGIFRDDYEQHCGRYLK